MPDTRTPSASVADDMIRSYFERWQRLEAEKDAISADLRELFAEMKGDGFDTKVARKVFRDNEADPNDRAEFEAVYDLYMAALSGPRAGRARERAAGDAEEITTKAPSTGDFNPAGAHEEFDAETGEIIEPQPQPAAQSQGNLSAPDVSPDRRECDDDGQPIQPETATKSLVNGPCEAISERTAPLVGASASAVDGGVGQPASISSPTGRVPGANVSDRTTVGVTVGGDESGTAPHLNSVSTEPPAQSTIAEVNRARPSICQNPDACHSSSWRVACFGCRKAAEERAA